MLTTKERFWAKVQKRGDDECWVWTGARCGYGHGRFRGNNGATLAHRISWSFAHGEDPPADLKVCHTCDVPYCVNPNHLFLGTQTDNLKDMTDKGRRRAKPFGRPPSHKGDSSPSAKISESDIEKIKILRSNGLTLREISGLYPVSIGHVSRLCKGRRNGRVKVGDHNS